MQNDNSENLKHLIQKKKEEKKLDQNNQIINDEEENKNEEESFTLSEEKNSIEDKNPKENIISEGKDNITIKGTQKTPYSNNIQKIDLFGQVATNIGPILPSPSNNKKDSLNSFYIKDENEPKWILDNQIKMKKNNSIWKNLNQTFAVSKLYSDIKNNVSPY